ncbi:hypothetical protein PMAYCL1PPCAC_33314, partial [Pristionchus mayeri]
KEAIPSSKPVVFCHRCGTGRMKEVVRKVTLKGGLIKEFPSYRCTRKGCQAFKPIREFETHQQSPPMYVIIRPFLPDIPTVFCHRCETPMKEWVRKVHIEGVLVKEYANYYRCTRSGCKAYNAKRVVKHPKLARKTSETRIKREQIVKEESLSSLPVVEIPLDPNEPVYCICQKASMDEMICCENPACIVEWYHLQCMGMSEGPPPGVRWFCESCRDSFKHIHNQWNYEANEPPPKIK